MYRPTHISIMRFLETLDANLLESMACYFGGGTAIAMLNHEYRLSVDVDFMCSSKEGYARLRETIGEHGLSAIFKSGKEPTFQREPRNDQYGVRAIINLDGAPLKFEIIHEGYIDLEPEPSELPVTTLSKQSLFAQKLMANMDRGLDQSGLSKDMLDLIVMQHHSGEIPEESVINAYSAYGAGIGKGYAKSFNLLAEHPSYLDKCFKALAINESYVSIIKEFLLSPDNASKVSDAIENIQEKSKVASRPK